MIKTVLAGGFSLMALGFVAIASVSADDGVYAHHNDKGVTVEAPHTRVDVDRERSRTRVEAPYTSVDVDRERRTIRIRVPFFNGDIRY